MPERKLRREQFNDDCVVRGAADQHGCGSGLPDVEIGDAYRPSRAPRTSGRLFDLRQQRLLDECAHRDQRLQ